jgi:hypothetical protein
MKTIPAKDDWKFRKPKITAAFYECAKCGGRDFRISGFKRHSDTEMAYRVDCPCGEQVVGRVTEKELISFLLVPDIQNLLHAFLPKPRTKEPEQETLL